MDKNLLANTTYKYAVKVVDVLVMNQYKAMYSQLPQKLKALHTKRGIQKRHIKREIESCTKGKCMKLSKITKEMGIQTGFMLYHYGKQCKLLLVLN